MPYSSHRNYTDNKRTDAGKLVNPAISLLELTLMQAFLVLQHAFSMRAEHRTVILLSFLTLAVLEWCVYQAMRLMDRLGFEIEILAFYLTTLGLSVTASALPEQLFDRGHMAGRLHEDIAPLQRQGVFRLVGGGEDVEHLVPLPQRHPQAGGGGTEGGDAAHQ
ncbi:MAG: hypothetical protein IJS50_03990, partial [Desulfovibrio sp.]|nr:hypothetical protein [Desulfovibrio sp.]